MYVNVAGAIELLYSPKYRAEAIVDVFTPENLIWISLIKGKLKFICHPKNINGTYELVKLHNEIYDSPLAKVMREY